MDWLSSLFLGAFLFGLLFCLASMLLGLGQFGHGHFGLPLHGSEGSGGGSAAHGGHSGHISADISPWNLIGLTAFVAWFGGVGYLALAGWQLAAWTSLLLAAAAGLAGWWLVFLFLSRVLAKGEKSMDPDDYRLEARSPELPFPSPPAGPARSSTARPACGTATGRAASTGRRSLGARKSSSSATSAA